MKHLKMSMYLLLIAAIFTSCEKETIAIPENSKLNVQFEEMGILEKQKLLNQIIENFQKSKGDVSAREEITYEGQLCGSNITGGYSDATDYQNLHIYYFNGNAGDVISIYVPRTTPGFDAGFNLYHESDNGNNIVNISRDDDVADSFGSCWSDPYLANYTLPYSGLYTLTVVSVVSCGFPYGYEIITTGINCNDADLDGVLNEDDLCVNTPNGESVNSNGCSESQLDDDIDGVNNSLDNCSNTPSGETVNENGCGESQLDDDHDGVMNNKDAHIYSDMREKMNIGGIHANIDNKMVKNGSTMMDQLNDLIAQTNAQYNGENYDYLHKRFMTELAQLTYKWRMARLITATQRSQISSIAWGATIPYYNNES